MELVLLKRNMLRVFTCVFLLLLQTAFSAEVSQDHNDNLHLNHKTENSYTNQNDSQNVQRRQGNSFDFMSYFMGKNAQQQQQQQTAPQQHSQTLQQQPSQIQQQHLLQQHLLQRQQQKQQEQLQLLQQQQLIQLQQQQRTPDVGYQDNAVHQQYQQPQDNIIHQQYQQPQDNVIHQYQSQSSRDGYGVGIGNGYQQGYAQEPKIVDIGIGGGAKPVIRVGNILTLLPKIINVLSGGGKVMFGVELGNNFYFGPVGAKPLQKLL